MILGVLVLKFRSYLTKAMSLSNKEKLFETLADQIKSKVEDKKGKNPVSIKDISTLKSVLKKSKENIIWNYLQSKEKQPEKK